MPALEQSDERATFRRQFGSNLAVQPRHSAKASLLAESHTARSRV